jgi:hypothetical protein
VANHHAVNARINQVVCTYFSSESARFLVRNVLSTYNNIALQLCVDEGEVQGSREYNTVYDIQRLDY